MKLFGSMRVLVVVVILSQPSQYIIHPFHQYGSGQNFQAFSSESSQVFSKTTPTFKMRSSLLVLVTLIATVSALPALTTTPINPAEVANPQNGDVVSECDDTTQLGNKSCLGTGFITCTHRGNIFRPCGAGTQCTSLGENNLTCE